MCYVPGGRWLIRAGLAIAYRKTEAEQGMLLNLHKTGWTEGLKLRDFEELQEGNEKAVKVGDGGLWSAESRRLTEHVLTLSQEMLSLASAYNKSVTEETTMTAEQLKTRHVGKLDPKRHLEEAVEKAMGDQITQSLAMGVLAEL
jgi:26S proteasome regulatory subunit N11